MTFYWATVTKIPAEKNINLPASNLKIIFLNRRTFCPTAILYSIHKNTYYYSRVNMRQS